MPEQLDLDAAKLAQTPYGRALLAGRLTATIVGRDEHITIKTATKAKIDGKWKSVSFDRATHIFISVPAADGGWADKIGTYYPSGKHAGLFWSERTADAPRIAAAVYALKAANGDNSAQHIVQARYCYRCGKELTTPQSIESGFGPECAAQIGAYHQGNGQHTPKTKGGDGTGDGTPPEQIVPDHLRDFNDDELTKVVAKAQERCNRDPGNADFSRQLERACNEQTRRAVEREAADPVDTPALFLIHRGDSATAILEAAVS